MDSTIDVPHLLSLRSSRVRLRLRDSHEFVGVLRTELLTDRSLSVYLDCGDGEGATIYIDQIVGIWPE